MKTALQKRVWEDDKMSKTKNSDKQTKVTGWGGEYMFKIVDK